MSACDRVDDAVDVDDLDADTRAHVAGCAACQARHAGYARIGSAFRALGAQHAPTSERRARLRAAVAAEVDRTPAQAAIGAPPSRRRRAFAIAGVALAAAAVLVFWLGHAPPPPPPRFDVAVVDGGGPAIRGDARLGDRLRVRARAGATIHVRVYRNDRELVLDCARACRRDGDVLVGEAVLDRVARYQVVWFDGAVPPSTGALEPDVAAAAAVGARHELRELVVR